MVFKPALSSRYKNKTLSFENLKKLKNEILSFLDENNSKLNRVLADKCNREGLKYSEITDIQGKKKFINIGKKVIFKDTLIQNHNLHSG